MVSFTVLYLILFRLIYSTFSNLKKLKWQKKEIQEIRKLKLYIKRLELSIYRYNSILKSNFISKIQYAINKEKLGLKFKTKLIGDNLYIYLLRNYIYKIVDEIIKEYNLRELIKEEILKVPITTFSEFLELYFELAEELTRISNKGDVISNYF